MPTLRHRIILNYEGEAERINTDDLVKGVIEHVVNQAKAATAAAH